MMVPPKVSRSTMAAQSLGSVKVLVQPEKDSLDAIAADAVDAERAGHCCILGSCVGSAYMGGQP
jgi:hypothetical protein